MPTKIKRICLTLIIMLLFSITAAPIQVFAQTKLQFTPEEQAIIADTQNGNPVKMGIIPHTFPLSACPPEKEDFVGINVEMLKKITQLSGLQFEYCRVPTELNTPYVSLKAGEFDLVAGTIKLDSFVNDANLILSDSFCDGSAICIAKQNTVPSALINGKVAVMSGHQAGTEFANQQFPDCEIVYCENNQEVVRAIRTGKADVAMISRYVGIYELQNPLNEKLVILAPYQMVKDSSIMGLNTPQNKRVMSIINKSLAQIGSDELNHIQMSFSLANPYKLNFTEFLFKYRYIFLISIVAFLTFFYLLSRLVYSQKEHKLLSRDNLTGAYTEAGFELVAKRVIAKSNEPVFITDFDISSFSSFNELNGNQEGDKLLKAVVEIVGTYICDKDAICRTYADNFKVISCKESLESLIKDIEHSAEQINNLYESKIALNVGVYPVSDTNIPISKMLDLASLAKKSIKGSTDKCVGVFDATLHQKSIRDAKMLSSFNAAIKNKEFAVYYQPKYDVITQNIIGAEALVRWKNADGSLVPPMQFIDLFEKNGQIQRLDFYMLEEVCVFQKSLLCQDLPIMPISVNFSRVHLYSGDFVQKVVEIVEKHNIPKAFIEIECTETTMTHDIEITKEIFGKLQSAGFAIAMDDFGKAYSSLNTLCMLPLDIIKLDSGFLMATLANEKEKADIIIKAIINLVHDLSLKIIAEGVETEEQFLFLKSLGCDYIQGYYFARPQDEQTFLSLLKSK